MLICLLKREGLDYIIRWVPARALAAILLQVCVFHGEGVRSGYFPVTRDLECHICNTWYNNHGNDNIKRSNSAAYIKYSRSLDLVNMFFFSYSFFNRLYISWKYLFARANMNACMPMHPIWAHLKDEIMRCTTDTQYKRFSPL